MKKILLTMVISCLSVCAQAEAVADYNVVPMPQSITMQKGGPFVLDENVSIYYEGGEDMRRNAEFLTDYVREATGLNLSVVTKKEKKFHQIQLVRLVSISSFEDGYRMTVRENGITIEGSAASGVFYGVQTLRKALFPLTRLPVAFPLQQGTVTMPAVTIQDEPRFEYRGMHLDCARHFFSVDFIKRYIDMLALHNINTFHWHLTDDQGWRLEIKRYPRVTEIGSMRTGTVIGNNSDVDDGIPYGGYYTQEETREIVRYAKQRYITVIPEIDVPGHAMAALASYPELGCTGGPYEVGHKWGVYNDVLCVGNALTYQFVRDVLDEVMQIFPSEVIHVGGDETPTVRWESCPKCNALNRQSMSYQGYFTRQITDYLAQHGRRAICWDESLEMGVDHSATIMSWRGMKPGIAAAVSGYDVIMTPLTHCYFDYYQTEEKNYEPSITGMWPISVEKVYGLEPVPDSLSTEAKSHIKGIQANIWTEQIASPRVVEYMLLPRLAALSEVAWTSPEKKDFEAFCQRITRLAQLYDYYGWTYAKHLWPERMVKDRWKI